MKLYGIDYLIIGITSFLGGVFYSKKFYKDKYAAEKEEEIANVKESYKHHFEETNDNANVEVVDDAIKVDASKQDPFTSKSSIDGLYSKKGEEAIPDDYLKKYINYTNVSEEAAAENESPEDDTPDEIREITVDDYISSTGHGQRSISYYAQNDVYVMEDRDEDEPEVIDDPHTLFGFIVEKTGWRYSDYPKVMYIRNDQLGMDYEITKYNSAYDW